MKSENLNTVTFDEGNGTYDLEFNVDGEMKYITVDASDHPEAATDEYYFDNEDVVNKIIEEYHE